jgi:hypothetical protein
MLRRFRFFGIGFIISLFAVSFFWSKKKVQFDYGMDARTLKSITYRQKNYSPDLLKLIQGENDSITNARMNEILMQGDVDFGKSKQHEKPAKYYIVSNYNNEKLILWIERGDSTASIKRINK